MKKGVIIFLIFFLFISQAYALNLTLAKSYSQGQTVVAEIKGSILGAINPSQIVIKRGTVAIAPIFDVKRIGEKYYVFFVSPMLANNYTLNLLNIATTVNGVPLTATVSTPFEVNSEIAPYTINPGIFIGKDEISVSITSNLDENQELSISSPISKTLTVKPGQNIFKISVSGIASGIYSLSIGTYSIPLEVLHSDSILSNSTENLELFPTNIEINMSKGESKTYSVFIRNKGNSSITDINLEGNSSIYALNPIKITEIKINSSVQLNITINSLSSNFSDVIIFRTKNNAFTLPISITLRTITNSNITSSNNSNNNSKPVQEQAYCQEKGGLFCAAGDECSKPVITTLDGQCCTGICVTPKESSYSWIIYVIIIILIMGGAYMYFKFKKGTNTSLPAKSLINIPSPK